MVTVNLEEMADKLRISLPTMRRMVRKYRDFPVVAEGGNGIAWQLDPEAVIDFVQRMRDEETASRAERDELLAQISLPIDDMLPPEQHVLSSSDRLKLAQARLKEIELQKQASQLVNKSEIRGPLSEAFTVLVQFFLGQPAQQGRRYNLPEAVVRDMRRDNEAQLRILHRKLCDILSPVEALPDPQGDEEHERAP
ncbi:hypothetical protein GXW78_07630 [Roseomonas terrae]|uniref:DNA-binding protein n=2 Tax=Neoroseomonas terrae TaxID=424799 RepID=A0ABS5EES7_9PROT|nr:hypothetical protein [Neoroseomonas terrae]